MIETVIQSIIASGGNTSSHLNWEQVASDAQLVVKQKRQTIVEKPGYEHIKWRDYVDQYGDIVKTDKGHMRYELQGEDGVL
eukprot:2030897-Pyramimonas_sp.AAC.1